WLIVAPENQKVERPKIKWHMLAYRNKICFFSYESFAMNEPLVLSAVVLEQLTAIVGETRVKTDHDSRMTWGKDWTKHFEPNPSVIVFPGSTEQVQAIIRLANQHHIAITPSGGRTGLSAGAVAANGEIVISLDRMNKVIEFLPADRM